MFNTIKKKLGQLIKNEQSKITQEKIKMSQENYFNEDGFVLCQYCSQPFKVITTQHLKKYHDMGIEEYKSRFPDAPLKWRPTDKYVEQFEKEKKRKLEIKNENIENKVDVNWDTSCALTKDIAFLILKEKYPNIQKNYIYKKLDNNGNVLFTFFVDFGDPSKRVLIDFEEMSWHAQTPLFTKYRKRELASQAKWKYINYENEFENIEEFLKVKK